MSSSEERAYAHLHNGNRCVAVGRRLVGCERRGPYPQRRTLPRQQRRQVDHLRRCHRRDCYLLEVGTMSNEAIDESVHSTKLVVAHKALLRLGVVGCGDKGLDQDKISWA